MWIELKLRKIKVLNMVLWLLLVTQVGATVSVPSLNDCPDMIFIDGNEDNSLPSNGSGGLFPGSMSRVINVAGIGNQTYYYYIPSSYQSSEALPLMMLWHGAAGAGQAANQAQSMIDLWEDEAESQNFIIVAQVATGASGGWVPGNDSQILGSIFDDMGARYNIENTRIYGWGFSAGGHVWHALGLQNTDFFAAYAVNAGVLAGFAGTTAPLSADRNLPVYVSVGSSDSLLSFAQNDTSVFLAGGWVEGKNYWLDVFTGGHVLPNDAPTKAWANICISTNLDE